MDEKADAIISIHIYTLHVIESNILHYVIPYIIWQTVQHHVNN